MTALPKEKAQAAVVKEIFRGFMPFRELARNHGVDALDHRYSVLEDDGRIVEYTLSVAYHDLPLALEKLTERQKAVVWQHLVLDRTQQDVAADFNRRLSTVQESINASLKTLAKHLFDEEVPVADHAT